MLVNIKLIKVAILIGCRQQCVNGRRYVFTIEFLYYALCVYLFTQQLLSVQNAIYVFWSDLTFPAGTPNKR
jgi:hypothetical protein